LKKPLFAHLSQKTEDKATALLHQKFSGLKKMRRFFPAPTLGQPSGVNDCRQMIEAG
jgi:hypothetical protein